MKYLIWVLLSVVSLASSAQTVDLEEAFLNKAIKDGKWTAEGMQERGRVWRTIKNDYPVLPYDTASKEFKFRYLIDYKGVNKIDAFKRAKEWGSLNFGSLDAVTDYEDFESGKLIFEGWCRVWYSSTVENMWGFTKVFPEERRLYFSMIITVLDGKAKVEFDNLEYLVRIPGYVNTLNVYVPMQEFRYPISVGFPLVNDSPDKWPGAVNLINNTVKVLSGFAPDLGKHIRSLSEDYRF